MLYLVRHGESLGNVNKRYCGITDIELSLDGKEQAKIAASNLEDLKVLNIYTSPLKRACETAKIISEEINVKLNIVDCLKEVNFGIFENMTWEETRNEYKEETDKWIEQGIKYTFPKGESYDDVINRIAKFMDNVEDDSVIVSHFGVIQSMLLYYKIADSNNLWKYHISNCDILVLNNKKLEKIIKCK